MDFFQRQDDAHRQTRMLFIYMAVAIAVITTIINAIVLGYMLIVFGPRAWSWENVAYATSGVLLVIGVGSLHRYRQIRKGGSALAAMVGAQYVLSNTEDHHQRRLVNVTEEMAIASGIKPPHLYVIPEERGINAFVAGFTPNDTCMVVTQGCLEQLDRDELQGVVGHEFSHILNGDMLINMRLIAILGGLWAIAQVGNFVFESGSMGRHRRRAPSKDKSAAASIAGLILYAIGWIGVLCGRIIKAKISRQREYLADASSVQFTRNPQGIAGALYKISQTIAGSALSNRHAEDMSHMCFGSTKMAGFNRWLTTHPPINDRINAIDPSFLKRMQVRAAHAQQSLQAAEENIDTHKDNEDITALASAGIAMLNEPKEMDRTMAVDTNTITDSIGNPTIDHIDYARALHKHIPKAILHHAHQTTGAIATLYALVLAGTEAERESSLVLINTAHGDECAQQTQRILSALSGKGRHLRLPLIDIATNTLQILDIEDRQKIGSTLGQLFKLDRRITLFEFVLATLVHQHLDIEISVTQHRRHKIKRGHTYKRFSEVKEALCILFAALLNMEKVSSEEKEKRYRDLTTQFSLDSAPELKSNKISISNLSHALDTLSQLNTILKKSVIAACADTLIVDHRIGISETELMRAICETLDCPMPPFLPRMC